MAESDEILRRRPLAGSHSARVSKCSSSGNPSSSRQSLASGLSIDTDETDQDAESWTDNGSALDLTGFVESSVDSDDDEIESDETTRDEVRESLEKIPGNRNEQDIRILLDFTQHLQAFANMTISMREALCKVMTFSVIDDAGTVIIHDNQVLDSWIVIIQGCVDIIEPDKPSAALSVGDDFGLCPENIDKQCYNRGVVQTKSDDCQLVRIARDDYVNILRQGKENIRHLEENGHVVLVTEERPHSNNPNQRSHVVIKGTINQLMDKLLDIPSGDPTYDEDFLLTYRIVMKTPDLLCDKLLDWFITNPNLRAKVARIVLLWVNNHFTDFDTKSSMVDFLEKFEALLEEAKMAGHLKMLDFAVQARSKPRMLTLARSRREEALQFNIVGGIERNSGIFVSHVDRGSKAEKIGLKRADQILQVNGKNVACSTQAKVMELLCSSTHLYLTVQTNLSSFKDAVKSQECASPKRISKRFELSNKGSDQQGNACQQDNMQDKRKSGWLTTKRNKEINRSSVFASYFGKLCGIVHLQNFNAKSLGHSSSSVQKDHTTRAEAQQVNRTNSVHRRRSMSMYVTRSIPDLTKMELYETKSEPPDSILKIYTADQSHKLIFARKETTVKDVLEEAVLEFQLSDPVSSYGLCEVTVTETGLVKQCRLPEDLQNLSDRLGINSRYYLKNYLSSEPLVTDDAMNELKREAQVSLLTLNPMHVAIQLTLEDFALFVKIESSEFIDDLFELNDKRTPNLERFSELANREMFWVISEICRESNGFRRMKIIKKFIKIADRCRQLRNFNSMFNIISGLSHNAVSRLKQTWGRLHDKHHRRFAYMQDLMNPSRNMSKYRNLVNCDTVHPPIIPFFPVVKKDITFIHLGNDTKVDGLINFEKFRMIAKELRNVQFMRSVPYDPVRMIEDFRVQPDRNLEKSLGVTTINGTPYNDMKRALPGTFKLARKKSMQMILSKKESLFEESQLERRVKAYLKYVEIILDEEHLSKVSKELEAPQSRRLNKSPNTSTVSPSSSNTPAEIPINKQRASPATSTASKQTTTPVASNNDLKNIRLSQELDRSVPITQTPGLLLTPALQAPSSPQVVRRLINQSALNHDSHSDVSFSEDGTSDYKATGNSLSAIRKSKLTWSCISTDSGVSSKSYSSQQHPVSSASSVDAYVGFCTPPMGSKVSSSLEALQKDDRQTHSIKQSINFHCYLGNKKKSRNRLEPLPNLLVPLYPGEAHGLASSSPTLPIVVIDEVDSVPKVNKLAFDFRKGIQVLPPLSMKSPVLQRAILRNAMPHAPEDNHQEPGHARTSLRRVRSEHELTF